MTGGGRIIGLGPRRDEASLSSTMLSLRKTLHWGSIHSVPLLLCSVQGCCLSWSPSRPPNRRMVVTAVLFSEPSTAPPLANRPVLCFQPEVFWGTESFWEGQDQANKAMMGSNVPHAFPSHSLLSLLTHVIPSPKSPNLLAHSSMAPGPQHYMKFILLPAILGILLFCFRPVRYQQVTGAKERLLHRKAISDPSASLLLHHIMIPAAN